jgi:2-octaprenyl-6-methoxyphenol hydroxylase
MPAAADTCDVLVAGGGPVGAAMACSLARHGVDVRLLEASPDPAVAFRPIALASGSRSILESIGVFGAIPSTPIETIHVSQAGGFGRTVIRREELGVPALGYVCDAGRLAGALADAAAPVLESGRVAAWRADADRVRVTVHTIDTVIAATETALVGAPREIAARLLVLADGGQAGGDDLAMRDYGQSAIVSRVRTEIAHRGVAWERFTADGPLALLPFGDGTLALVWTVPAARAPGLAAASGEHFLASLAAQFGERLGRFTDAGPRSSFPLRLWYRRSNTPAPRVVAIGNAAQTLHPVAGQGLNLGLRDAAELAALVARDDRASVGGPGFLAAFRTARRIDRFGAIGVTDFLVNVFSSGNPLLRAARGAGLVALDLVPPARRVFARRMMLGARGFP